MVTTSNASTAIIPPQESANGAIVTTVGPAIVNSAGEAWTLTTTGLIAVNGKPDTTTANVVALEYVNHILYQKNAAGGWWSKHVASDPWTVSAAPVLPTRAAGNPTVKLPGIAPADTVGKAAALSGISIADPNAASGSFTLSVSASTGQLALSATQGTVSGSGTGAVTIKGTLAQLNADLATLSFTGAAAGKSTLSFAVTDATGAKATALLGVVVSAPAPSESVNGTIVTTVGPAIVDSAGEKWTLTSNGLVAVNGTPDATTANVKKLEYANHLLYQQNAAGGWWSKHAANDAWTSSVAPPGAGNPTINLPTSAPTDTVGQATAISGVSVADPNAADGNFSLTASASSGQLALSAAQGSMSGSGTGAVMIKGTLAQINADLATLSFIGAAAGKSTLSLAVTDATGVKATATLGVTVNAPAPVESANGTIVTTVGPAIVDSAGEKWSLTSNGLVAVNGTPDATTANVTKLDYFNHLLYQQNAAGGWWYKQVASDAWTSSATPPGGTPPPSGPPIVIAQNSGAGPLLPYGQFLHTSGSQIVDQNGTPVRINSVGWSGSDNNGFNPDGLWSVNYQTTMKQMVQLGFNTTRLPWTNALLHGGMPTSINYTANPDLQGLNGMQVLDKIISYAGQIGLKVILDHHTDDGSGGQQPNGLWYDSGGASDGTDGAGNKGTVTQQSFVNDWVTVAQKYANDPTVIGFDLDNEPEYSTWGGDANHSIQQMSVQTGNAIQAVNPNALIIVESAQTYPNGPEGDYSEVATNPVTLNVPNHVVYSPHEYGPEIDGAMFDGKPADYIAQMNHAWGYLITQNIAPVFIGEMGSDLANPTEQLWAQTLAGYVGGQDGASGGPVYSGNQQGVSTDWWAWGNYGAFGLLGSDWTTVRADQYAQIKQYWQTTHGAAAPAMAITATTLNTPSSMAFANPPPPTGTAQILSDSGNAIRAAVTNTAPNAATGWSIELDTTQSVTEVGGGAILGHKGNAWVIGNASTDGALAANGGSASLSVTLSGADPKAAIGLLTMTH